MPVCQGPTVTLPIRDLQQPLGWGPTQPFATKRGARDFYLLIDHGEKIIDRETQCRTSDHPQRHTDAKRLFAGGAQRVGSIYGFSFAHWGWHHLMDT